VGFRFWARNTAHALGLTGFVRNNPDGSVVIEAEGDADSLNHLVEACRQGPPHSVVKQVQHGFQEVCGFKDFRIL